MLRRSCFVPFALFLVVVFAGQASALYVQDVYTSDMNVITQQYAGVGEYFVYEDYNELHLVPYLSHDGMAIVNAEGQYFDKIVTKETGDVGPNNLHFNVTNTTPYLWSDYHIEFWDATFTQRLVGAPIMWWVDGHHEVIDLDGDGDYESVWVDPMINTALSPDGSIVQWWAPKQLSWEYDPPGSPWTIYPGGQDPWETNWFQVQVNLDMLPPTFGIRQVATTIPEPASLLLLGLGLAGLIGWKRRSRK